MQETHKLSDNLAALKEKIETGLEGLSNSKELYEFRSSYLEGKKSKISELMKEMRNLAPEERAGYGKSVNELKEWAIDRFSKMEEKMKQLELQRRYESEKIDLTLPADETGVGNLHPITLVRNQLIDIFAGMGFEVYEGAEIRNDYYNFTALNTPRIIRQEICRIPSISPRNSCFVPRHRQARFMSWKTKAADQDPFPGRVFRLMTTQPILRCSIRWRDSLSTKTSPSAT